METYNLNKLIKVRVYKEQPSRQWKHLNEKKFLGIVYQQEGFYTHFNYSKTIPDKHFYIDGVVIEKPEVVLTFQNDVVKRIVFESYENAKKYALRLTVGTNWLDIK